MKRPPRRGIKRQRHVKRRRERGEWIAQVRSNPKQAMEEDLGVAGAGLAIFVLDGVVAVAGYHPKWQNIHINSLHPATYMPTKMVLEEIGHSIDSLEDGVTATHRLVSDPNLSGATGKFFDQAREARANDQAYDGDVRAELWERSLELVNEPDSIPDLPKRTSSREER